MLSNINSDKEQILQIVLVGQPQLRDLLQSPELTQFAQRITSDFHLSPLQPIEAIEYIFLRVRQAGGSRSLFSHPATKLVAEVTGGNPRMINMLCDTALVYAFSSQKPYVSYGLMSQVIEDKSKHGLFFKPQRSITAQK